MMTSDKKGFSLIELMTVLAVISILSAIAIPNYSDYVTKSRIPSATSNLANRRVLMEQYFQDNRTYEGAAGDSLCPPSPVAINPFFNILCYDTPDKEYYKLRAVGAGSMQGFEFTIDSEGNRESVISGGPTASGWRSNSTCWISGKGGQC